MFPFVHNVYMCVSISYLDRLEHRKCFHSYVCVCIIYLDCYWEQFRWMIHMSSVQGYGTAPLMTCIYLTRRTTQRTTHYGQMEAQPYIICWIFSNTTNRTWNKICYHQQFNYSHPPCLLQQWLICQEGLHCSYTGVVNLKGYLIAIFFTYLYFWHGEYNITFLKH